jgi:hypothetical protein
MHNCSVGGRALNSPARTLACVILLCTFGSSSRAWAQGMNDWGMWFGTLLVIGALAALVFFLITLVRWLKR